MRFTTLKKTSSGVVLRELHAARLGLDDARALDAFDRFTTQSPPGVYALWNDSGTLRHEARGSISSLFDWMPVRYLPSPNAGLSGRFPKQSSPGPYDGVRMDGTATLLTTFDGIELLESCRAAILCWDGRHFMHPPDDRPRVWSVAEEAVRQNLPVVAAPVTLLGNMPLVLVNAVKGACQVSLPGRAAMPQDALQLLENLFTALTR
jgi:hypothetical protein